MKTPAAPQFRSVNQLPERLTMTPLDRKARDLEAARRCIDKLDQNASLDLEDRIPPTLISIDELLHNLASWVCKTFGEHHGLGSWNASHRLRTLTQPELNGALITLGASPFLIEQYGGELLTRVHGLSHRGGEVR